MPRKILIVDDNAIIRQMLINALSGDYDIIEAENGRQALSVMHRSYKMLSAVLLDIVMPEMDGYEVLRRIRENAVLSQLPVIMVTGSEDDAARVKALSIGANDFILKPFNSEIVKHCLRNNIIMRENASTLNAIQKDKLTGLFNRETFFDKAGAMICDKEAGYYLLSSFDIDNFKLINEQFGAAEGDRVLKEISIALKNSMALIGGLCGRISSDNFAALFPVSKSDTDVLQRIQNKSLARIESQALVFSIGRYIIEDKTIHASSAYDRAYLAKQTVKKRFDTHLAYFDETMLDKLIRDQKIAASMEAALSESQLYDVFRDDLIDVITGFVSEYAIPRELLRLEITESAFSKSTKAIVSIVKKFVALGFIVEIDDFGSGYSSLNTLKSVPAQIVKLDMRFLEDDDDEQRGGNIIESVVRMSKWLGMSVVAEGVETKAQGDFLKSIGCSCVQGYLYARPMPAADYENLLENSESDGSLQTLTAVENLNNDAFWSPSSIDSLIFNSYVGAACIYEYHNGSIELIRATDKYAQMFGEAMTVEKLMQLDFADYGDRDFVAETNKKIEASVHSKEEIIGEFLFAGMPECPPEIFIRSHMRVISSVDNRHLLYCLNENITEQRLSERKERQTADRLQAVLDHVNCGITATVNNDRYTHFLFANKKYYDLIGYTKELYSKEIGADSYLTICQEDRDYTTKTVQHTILTGDAAVMEYRALRRDGSIIWLRSYMSVTGMNGIDRPVLFCTYADITVEKNTAQDLLDNLPCGAGICVVSDDEMRMTYLNKKYFSYFTHSIGARRTPSVFDVIYPDDHATLKYALHNVLNKGDEGSCIVRILDGSDQYLPFRISGIAMEPEDRQNFIYVTLIPIEQEKVSFSEMLPVALEIMMESSSELLFIKDINLRYICCSHAFAVMAGLDSEKDVIGKTDYDLFDKALADQYVSDDRRLMQNKKSIVDMVEKLPLDGDRQRWSVTSKYLLRDNDDRIIGIYGKGRDVTHLHDEKSQQQFLINNIPGGVATYEGKWTNLESIRLTYFSDGFCRLFGYSREEYEKLGYANPTGLIDEEYVDGFVKQIDALIQKGTPIDYLYRAKAKNGEYRWINVKAIMGEKHGDNMTANALLLDVTARQDALERLRVSEEENRLAMQHSKNVVCRYDIQGRYLKFSSKISAIYELDSLMADVPYGQVKAKRISPETADAYVEFYENIISGKKRGSVVFQRMSTDGWRWIEAHSSTIFSSSGEPISAVISFTDVTDNFEREIAYKKWLQSLRMKSPETYSLYRCNIANKMVFDMSQGSLLRMEFEPGEFKFDNHTQDYTEKFVYEEDRETYRSFLNVEELQKKFREGERIISIDFREKQQSGEIRWLRLTVEMVEFTHTSSAENIEAYLLFENIDEAKRSELSVIEKSENDSLTCLLNRGTFMEKVNRTVHNAKPDAQHALLMMDVDGFKLVNDAFGHGTGDQALKDIAQILCDAFRKGDLVGRLGGDEFVVFLKDIPNEKLVAVKASHICKLCQKAISVEVGISVSVGIALCPQDGASFDALYKKADEAMYYVKGSGGNNFAFYGEDMNDEHLKPDVQSHTGDEKRHSDEKRRMLIVDDSRIDNEMLANIFAKDFIIEKARDGNTALVRLRHYGAAISVVLLDLMMPGMDGFAVLEKMRKNPGTANIPVVVVSGSEDREVGLRAIREGASDFVIKPVDPEVLAIRVRSAISKAENNRLIVKNSLLEQLHSEAASYKSILEKMGLVMIELELGSERFVYDANIHGVLKGVYDERTLWSIWLNDGTAKSETVERIQSLTEALITDDQKTEDQMTAELCTPGGEIKNFNLCMHKFRQLDGTPKKIIIAIQMIDLCM